MKSELPSSLAAKDSVITLIDEYLAEQRRLQTPVARFSTRSLLSSTRSYQDLIPLSRPAPGEQYAFQVDLDACTGCKACVAGCHSLNGLDENETWRDVGLLLGGDSRHPFQQTVTTACHHCADPGCLNGCPVLAYEKDPVTGIVRHLDDQCIGCQYCVLKCPYDVPKYSERLGIVRKCDMCHDRLAEGEAPACVQSCPTQAISIVRVIASPAPDTSAFLPGAPSPDYTQPTTRYVSSRPIPANVHAADHETLRPQPPHWPLVFMLVLTQASVGLLIAGERVGALAVALAGIGASVLHLGQPFRAWRAFLGLRRSWLSREILVFGGYLPLLAAETFLGQPLGAGIVGLAGVLCSIMIYVDTRRKSWALPWTSLRFLGTVAVVATTTAAATGARELSGTVLALIAIIALKMIGETLRPRHPSSRRKLAATVDRRAQGTRFVLGTVGGVLLPLAAWANPAESGGTLTLALLLLLGGELAERYLYFTTVDAPKMPGMPQR